MSEHAAEIMVCIIMAGIILSAFWHFHSQAVDFRNECHSRGGHVKVIDGSRSDAHLCLSPQDVLLDSEDI